MKFTDETIAELDSIGNRISEMIEQYPEDSPEYEALAKIIHAIDEAIGETPEEEDEDSIVREYRCPHCSGNFEIDLLTFYSKDELERAGRAHSNLDFEDECEICGHNLNFIVEVPYDRDRDGYSVELTVISTEPE